MSPNSPRADGRRAESGFTLVEVLVAMTILVVVVSLSMTVLFLMQRFAQRQQVYVEPRQTARRACDYLSYFVRGASDLNSSLSNNNAIVCWYKDGSGVAQQATWNNVTNGALADLSTDVVSLAVPSDGLFVPVVNWPGWQHAATLQFKYGEGCPDSLKNLQMFKELTGAYIAPNGHEMSPVLMLVGDNGWGYYQITDYQDNVNRDNCTHPNAGTDPPAIDVQNNPGLSDGINPPGGQPDLKNPRLAAINFTSFRIKTVNGVPQLQQKWGLFNPVSPDYGFNELIDNVLDFQVAWIFRDGTVWNDSAAHRLITTNNVPEQVGLPDDSTPVPPPGLRDVTNVIGMRISLIARSEEMPQTVMTVARARRPGAEDRAGASASELDRRYYYRMTATQMLRNRMPGE